MPPPPPAELARQHADLVVRLDGNESTAADLERKLAAGLESRLAANQTLADHQANTLLGALGSRQAALNATAAKLAAKLQKHLLRKLGQAYTYAYPYGMVYPTDQHVVYGLETGDILGSMGLAPPADSAGKSPVNAQPAPLVGVPPTVGETAPSVGLPAGPTVPPVNPTFPPVGPADQPVYVPADQGAGPFGPQSPPTGAPRIDECPPGQFRDPATGTCTGLPSLPATSPGAPNTCPPGFTWAATKAPTDTIVPPRGGPRSQSSSETSQLQTVPAVNPRLTDRDYIDRGCGIHIAFFGVADPNAINQVPGAPGPTQFVYLGDINTPPPPEDGQMDFVCYTWPPDPFPELRDVVHCGWVPAGWAIWVNVPSGYVRAGLVPRPDACFVREVSRQRQVPYTPQPGPPLAPPPPAGIPEPDQGGQCVPIAEPEPTGEVCPVPKKPACGPTFGGTLPPLAGADSDVCKAIADAIDKLKSQAPDLTKWIGMGADAIEDDGLAGQVMRAILGVAGPVLPGVMNRFATWLQAVLQKANEGINCEPLTLLPIIINRAVFRLIEHWTGAVPAQLLTSLEQIGNTVCQSVLPSVSEADQAYLAATIDDAVWTCWIKADGRHVTEARSVRDAGRARLSVTQAVQAKMRELIGDERYSKLTRQGGILDDQDLSDIWALEQFWPGPGHLINWLVRDVFDDDVVKKFELDTDFEQKYTEETRKWANGMGVSEEQLRYEWRAHWRHMSTGQMLDAFHRLRPGDVPDDVALTREDLEQALKQEDLPPYWIRRMIYLSYAKPTRVDVRRMFEYHLIEEDDLKKRVLDLGYRPEDADLLVSFWKTDRRQKELKKNGMPTTRTMVTSYARGEVTKAELSDYASEVTYYDGQDQEIMDAADFARTLATRKAAISAVRRRYTTGLIGPGDAAAELATVGIESAEIDNLMNWWDQVKKRTGKEATAAMLCTWHTDRLITSAAMLGALIRLGYSGQDAGLIVADCDYKIELAAQRNTQKAQASAMKAAAQAAKTEAANQKAKVRSTRTTTPPQANGSPA